MKLREVLNRLSKRKMSTLWRKANENKAIHICASFMWSGTCY